MAGTQTIGESTIPEGASLLLVNLPTGARYFLSYQVYGVTMLYEVGDQARLQELFGVGATGEFSEYRRLNQRQFNQLGGIEMGWADEQVGADESMQAQIDRGIRQAGFEDLPGWMRRNREIMTLLVQGTAEGWSAGRIMTQISSTEGFGARFPGFNAVKRRLGGGQNTTIGAAVELYLQEEASLRNLLRRYRGADTNASVEYIGQIISSGWSASEASEVLRAEAYLADTPQAMRQLNAILRANGLKPIRDEEFLDVMRGNAPTQVYEALNDALRLQALREQGLRVDPTLVASFGQEIAEGVASAAEIQQFSLSARQAAQDLMANWREVDVARYGISREDVISAAFGEGFAAETEAKLLKFSRERQGAAEGYGGSSAYQSDEGRLVITGLQGL